MNIEAARLIRDACVKRGIENGFDLGLFGILQQVNDCVRKHEIKKEVQSLLKIQK